MTASIGPHGQGIGGPVQVTDDPNAPTFDPATRQSRDTRIAAMIENPVFSDWERNFLAGIYGVERMTARQRKTFIGLSYKAKDST